jgi:hypothetical protein
MNRCILVLLAVAGPGLVVTSWRANRAWSTCQQTLDREEERGQALDDAMRRQREFFTFQVAVMKQMRAGALHLSEATLCLHDYAALYHPRYLEDIDLLTAGRSLHEKVARNLAKSFLGTVPMTAPWMVDDAFHARIEQELDETLVKVHDDAGTRAQARHDLSRQLSSANGSIWTGTRNDW